MVWQKIILKTLSPGWYWFIGVFQGLLSKNYQVESKVEDRWLSVDEIADYLGIKRDTVYKWIAEKDMPANKIGRLWKFKKDEVDGWIRDGKAGENSNQE